MAHNHPDCMTTRLITDKAEILAYLETDRDYAAYAIGDLDEGFFDKSTWYVAEQGGKTRALALVYAGFDPPILVLMGEGDGVAALLDGPVQVQRACPMVQEKHMPMLGRYYRWRKSDVWAMWRMALRSPNVGARHASPLQAISLTLDDVPRLHALFALGGGDAFAPSQIAQGAFYGIEQDGQLIAAAGTHLVSRTYSVAAVGNVMTHPDHRGHGYATLVTGAVCAELVRRGIKTIVLNVSQANAAAVRVYEKLGFVRHCAFYEGMIERKP